MPDQRTSYIDLAEPRREVQSSLVPFLAKRCQIRLVIQQRLHFFGCRIDKPHDPLFGRRFGARPRFRLFDDRQPLLELIALQPMQRPWSGRVRHLQIEQTVLEFGFPGDRLRRSVASNSIQSNLQCVVLDIRDFVGDRIRSTQAVVHRHFAIGELKGQRIEHAFQTRRQYSGIRISRLFHLPEHLVNGFFVQHPTAQQGVRRCFHRFGRGIFAGGRAAGGVEWRVIGTQRIVRFI